LRLAAELRSASMGSRRKGNVTRSGFVVLIGLVDGDAAEIFGQLQQALVVVIPVGGCFIDHHSALVREAELDETGLANVGARPARLSGVEAIVKERGFEHCIPVAGEKSVLSSVAVGVFAVLPFSADPLLLTARC